jgi:hypothetical protein
MARYKIEYEIDSTRRADALATGEIIDYPDSAYVSAYVLPAHAVPGTGKVTRLPDPPIKQRFIVEIESPADLPVIQPHHVRNFFFSMTPISPERTVTVTPG